MKPEENGSARTCETPGCDKEARLQCPTCIKLQIQVNLYNKNLDLKLQIDCSSSFNEFFFSGVFFLQPRMFYGKLGSSQSTS